MSVQQKHVQKVVYIKGQHLALLGYCIYVETDKVKRRSYQLHLLKPIWKIYELFNIQKAWSLTEKFVILPCATCFPPDFTKAEPS